MDLTIQELQSKLTSSKIKCDEPMSRHTSFRIGGPAEYYLETESIEDFIIAVNFIRKKNFPFFILGGGSNILFSDEGVKGLVIKNNCRQVYIISDDNSSTDYKLVYSDAGAMMHQLVMFTIREGLSGLEYHLGLPGTVGGAIYMNSNFPRRNAYVGDVVHIVKLLTLDGEIKEVGKDYFDFAYDKSILQKTGEIVLSVIFKLQPENSNVLMERGQESVDYRFRTQPKGPSAGCFFRNISPEEAADAIIPDGITSAGYLIDKAGLKGKQIGDAVISDKHANYILNIGNARAADVMELMQLAREEVKNKFGIDLETEVKLIGF